jgi:hypothetical protein
MAHPYSRNRNRYRYRGRILGFLVDFGPDTDLDPDIKRGVNGEGDRETASRRYRVGRRVSGIYETAHTVCAVRYVPRHRCRVGRGASPRHRAVHRIARLTGQGNGDARMAKPLLKGGLTGERIPALMIPI